MALNSGSGMDHDARLARIYRAAGDETPPLRLDQAICAAARREAGAGPRSLSRLRAWRATKFPIASLCSSVLSMCPVPSEVGVMVCRLSLFRIEQKAIFQTRYQDVLRAIV